LSYAEFEAETRQNAMRAGVVGAILGAVVSVVGIRIVWIQNAQRLQFDRLASSSVVQQQRRLVQAPAEAIPDPYAQQKESNALSAQPEKESDSQSAPSNEVVLGYIKVIHWTRDYGVESLDMDDGRSIHPSPEPSSWVYFMIAMCPVVGFFIPWGGVRIFSGEGILFSQRHAEGQDPTAHQVRRHREY